MEKTADVFSPTDVLKTTFLRIPSIFRKSKTTVQTPKVCEQRTPPTKDNNEKHKAVTLKDLFPVTRYSSSSKKSGKKETKSSKEAVSSTERVALVDAKRNKTPRKRPIRMNFRENDGLDDYLMDEKNKVVGEKPIRKSVTEEGSSTTAAAKLLLEASRRMQDLQSTQSDDTSANLNSAGKESAGNITSSETKQSPQHSTDELFSEKCDATRSQHSSMFVVQKLLESVEQLKQAIQYEQELYELQCSMCCTFSTRFQDPETSRMVQLESNEPSETIEQMIHKQKKLISLVKETLNTLEGTANEWMETVHIQ